MDYPLSSDITKVEKNFHVISDQSLLDTQDMPLSTALKAAGWKDGQWVKSSGSSLKELVATDATAKRDSFCIFTGSETLSDPTSDTYATNKLTVIISAGWIGRTKEFTNTPVAGDLLCAKSGKLVKAANAGEERVAVAVALGPVVDGYLEFRAL